MTHLDKAREYAREQMKYLPPITVVDVPDRRDMRDPEQYALKLMYLAQQLNTTLSSLI